MIAMEEAGADSLFATDAANAELIAAMRNASPGLLDEIERLTAENRALEIRLATCESLARNKAGYDHLRDH